MDLETFIFVSDFLLHYPYINVTFIVGMKEKDVEKLM